MDTHSSFRSNGQSSADAAAKTDGGLNSLGTSIEDISGKVSAMASGLSEKTLSTIKKYPIHTALAAAGVGFLVGSMVSRKS